MLRKGKKKRKRKILTHQEEASPQKDNQDIIHVVGTTLNPDCSYYLARKSSPLLPQRQINRQLLCSLSQRRTLYLSSDHKS